MAEPQVMLGRVLARRRRFPVVAVLLGICGNAASARPSTACGSAIRGVDGMRRLASARGREAPQWY